MYGEEGHRQPRPHEAPRRRQAAEGAGPGRVSLTPGAALGYDGGMYDVHAGPYDPRHAERRHRRGESVSTSFSDSRQRLPGCFITAWAFCLVSVATLAVPVVFFLLPLIKASLFAATQHDRAFSPSTTTRPLTPPPPVAPKTMATFVVAPDSIHTSHATHQDCLKLSPGVSGAKDSINVPSKAHLLPAPNIIDGGKNQPIYCLYNVTRFRRPLGYYFLPFYLPYALCPNVVYWSWSLPGGALTSRAKEFDEKEGLAAIKKAAQDQGETVDTFLALGGYAEDSVDFYRVQNDYKTRHRLVQSLYHTYRRYELSGVTLHWVSHEPICESMFGGSVPKIGEFIDDLRLLISLNVGNSQFKVSAMVDSREDMQMEFFRTHQSRLNMTFFKTHHLLSANNFDENCEYSVPVFASQLAHVKAFFRLQNLHLKGSATPSEEYKGLCVSMSLALYAREGHRLERPAPPQPVSQMPGYMGLVEVCDSHLNFSDVSGAIPGCIFGKTSGSLMNVTFAFDDITTLRAKMNVLGNGTQLCVLLYDVDFDNYKAQCTISGGGRYLMLQHFYSARITGSRFNITNLIPRFTLPRLP